MPKELSQTEVEEEAEKKYQVWICCYGRANAKRLCKELWKLFREEGK